MSVPNNNMKPDNQDLLVKLAEIKAQYVEQLPERVSNFASEWKQCGETGYQEDCLKNLFRMAHGLKGSGATFGFEKISMLAAILDTAFSSFIESGDKLSEESIRQVDEYIAELGICVEESKLQETKEPVIVEPGFRTKAEHEENNLIFLVEDDELVARDLSTQLGHFGYEVLVIHDNEKLCDAHKDHKPVVIISGIMFPGNEDGGFSALEKCRNMDIELPPIIFISARDDFEARLKAAQQGAVSYIQKPVDIPSLVDALDGLSRAEEEPFRVLIVDDSESLASFYAATLESEGMIVQILTDPREVLQVTSEFSPELILMDMYMPECNGMDVASVIRQNETYVGIPIVFLSAEKNIDKQLYAMSLGGDDFLTKPIQSEHLISSVTSRLIRSRKLHSLMVRDSLTGLYNHTKTKELLDLEISRAERQNGHLIFAMIDIDNFKSVNDTYGHPVGDQVIKSLSRLLQQRLRKSDIVGRYGGEEFAVVLSDTSINAATKVLNAIRDNFSQIRQKGGDTEFHVTFSCGIAAFPDYKEVASISEAADKALYVAKEKGRNRVEVAGKAE